MEVGTLVLHRYNGDEVYSVKSSTITAFKEDVAVQLFLYVDTKAKPIKSLPDTAEFATQPNAEIYITIEEFDVSQLVGSQFSIPNSWDELKQDHVACFYYFDHGDLNKNVVRVVKQQGNKFLIHWTATTTDINHYDGSKPDTNVEVNAWFTFKHFRKWTNTKPESTTDTAE